MYAIINNNTVEQYPLTITDLKHLFPQVSFSNQPNEEYLATLNVVSVLDTNSPEYDMMTQQLVEEQPEKQPQGWVQVWSIQDLPQEEIAIRLSNQRNNMICTPRQASLALLQAGLLDVVENWIATQPRQTQIDWTRATEIRRDWPLINEAGVALNLSETQLDDLFLLAKTL